MPIFKTTQYIFNNPWGAEFDALIPTPTSSNPPKENWKETKPPKLSDIKLWEEIYYKTGEIGIYGAWDPYTNFYIIVHNLFINTSAGIEIFSGDNADDEVWNRAKELGIELSTSAPP